MIRILSAQLILLTDESIPISEGFDSEPASALETLSKSETAVNWGANELLIPTFLLQSLKISKVMVQNSDG